MFSFIYLIIHLFIHSLILVVMCHKATQMSLYKTVYTVKFCTWQKLNIQCFYCWLF